MVLKKKKKKRSANQGLWKRRALEEKRCSLELLQGMYWKEHFRKENGSPYIESIETKQEFSDFCKLFVSLLPRVELRSHVCKTGMCFSNEPQSRPRSHASFCLFVCLWHSQQCSGLALTLYSGITPG